MKLPHNISRIEAFSDAVFAFAATLMVVNFNLENTIEFSRSSLTGFLSFFVSFFVLVTLWWIHYNFFRRTKHMDNYLIAINAILLFVTLYYVFPLKNLVESWMGEGVRTANDLANLFVMYGIGFLLIFLCFSLMYYRAYKKSTKLNKAMELLFYARHFGIFVLIALASIFMALTGWQIKYGSPGFVYMLLGPFCAWHSKLYFKKYQLES